MGKHPYDTPYTQRARLEWQALLAVLKAKPCLDCGGVFPQCCMDFDHRDPRTKLFDIANGGTRRIAVLRAEMAKCDVICSNCHRIRTANRGTKRGYVARIGVESDQLPLL